jgi:hypothetical protein
LLIRHGLLKAHKVVNDENFIRGVAVFDERHTKADQVIADIHRESIRLLCGEESVQLLEQVRRMTTSTWMVTGGHTEGINASTKLHVVTKRLTSMSDSTSRPSSKSKRR